MPVSTKVNGWTMHTACTSFRRTQAVRTVCMGRLGEKDGMQPYYQSRGVSYRSECVAAFAVWWMVVDDGCGSGRNNNIEHREDSSALGHYVTDENSYFC